MSVPGADPRVLGPYLARELGDSRWEEPTVEVVVGGRSNLTYYVSQPGRRGGAAPPAAAASAADRARHGPRAPGDLRAARHRGPGAPAAAAVHRPRRARRAVLRDGTGRRGIVVADRPPARVRRPPDRRRARGRRARRRARRPARRRPGAVGLADFGRPEGYLDRQVRRWTEQWEAPRTADRPGLDALAARLAEPVPAQPQRAGIVHGDYRLDNVLLDPDDPARIAAVLDWEMSTLGDPLADLGLLLVYWQPAGGRARSTPSVDQPARLPRPVARSRAVRRAHRRRPVRAALVRRASAASSSPSSSPASWPGSGPARWSTTPTTGSAPGSARWPRRAGRRWPAG